MNTAGSEGVAREGPTTNPGPAPRHGHLDPRLHTFQHGLLLLGCHALAPHDAYNDSYASCRE